MIKGYTGFNKDLQCTPFDKTFQYEVGKEYDEEFAECGETGFCFCENPLDVLRYYSAADSRFCEVEGEGEVSRSNKDSKVVVSRIKIGNEIALDNLIKTGVKYITSKIDCCSTPSSSTGYHSTAASTGNCSTAANTGEFSIAANAGGFSTAASTGNCYLTSVTGNNSLAVSIGINGTAKGDLGCWIALAEWRRDRAGKWLINNIKIHKVDGKLILPNVAYKLKDGKFVQAQEREAKSRCKSRWKC